MKPKKPSATQQLALKKTEFREGMKTQITLLSELSSISVKLQHYEQAARYRDIEKDFQDALRYLESTDL